MIMIIIMIMIMIIIIITCAADFLKILNISF